MSDITGSFIHDSRKRTYTGYLPSEYKATETYPLFVLLHGGGGTGKAILNKTGFRAAADTKGFIVIAPDGYEKSWNDGRGSTDAELAGIDDVGFLKAAVARAVAELPIDSDRVYAVGHSSGGILALRCALEAADVFAGVGACAASIATLIAGGVSTGTVSVITIHGTDDPMIPFEGGQTGRKDNNGLVESAMNTAVLFAGHNGCAADPVVEKLPSKVRDGTKITRYTFQSCEPGTAMVLNAVKNMGHQWPPTKERVCTLGKTSKNIDATATICEFLLGQ